MTAAQTEKTYLFYDTETTGINCCFDQIIQFAAIRTTLDLKEIERFEWTVQLNPDTLPQPEAFLTHRIPLSALEQGLSDDASAQKLHRLFNTPNTISLGYNTLGFDDNLLRFTFFRNLLPSYEHQYKNGCSRMDLYPMMAFYYLYARKAIQWPLLDGQLSLKLDRLNALNGWADGPAHTAMADVEATLGLARSLAKEEKIWAFCTGYFHKKNDQQRISTLKTTHQVHPKDMPRSLGLAIHSKMGFPNRFQAPALCLGQHTLYSNQNIWLRLDHPLDCSSDLDALIASAVILRKKAGEPPFILPYTPHYAEALSAEREAVCTKNLDALAQHPALFDALVLHLCQEPYPDVANLDPDAALYACGFPSQRDAQHSRALHAAKDEDKKGFIDLLEDRGMQVRAWRMLYRRNPDLLTKKEAQAMEQHLYLLYGPEPEHPARDYRNQARPHAAEVVARIHALLDESQDEASTTLLKSLEKHIQKQVLNTMKSTGLLTTLSEE